MSMYRYLKERASKGLPTSSQAGLPENVLKEVNERVANTLEERPSAGKKQNYTIDIPQIGSHPGLALPFHFTFLAHYLLFASHLTRNLFTATKISVPRVFPFPGKNRRLSTSYLLT